METKYYNPSNNFRAPIPREPKPYSPPPRKKSEVVIPQLPLPEPEENRARSEKVSSQSVDMKRPANALGLKLDSDEWLLIGIILLLLMNACDDYLLIAILGYLLLTGKQ